MKAFSVVMVMAIFSMVTLMCLDLSQGAPGFYRKYRPIGISRRRFTYANPWVQRRHQSFSFGSPSPSSNRYPYAVDNSDNESTFYVPA